jgi:sulfur-carrier protein adenylyltransferase/sulfurtransferase
MYLQDEVSQVDRFESSPLDGEDCELTPRGLRQQLSSSRNVLLVDVRQGWEHRLVHLQGALLIPLHELPSRSGELDPARPIVVYCHYGIRSDDATVFLCSLGFPSVQSL